MKHIFENNYMEKYIPKEYLGNGRQGILYGFLKDLSYSLYGNKKLHGKFNYNMRNQQLKYINSIRDVSIVEMREDTIITYCEKLAKIVIQDLLEKYNIKEKVSNTYTLSISRYEDDNYFKSLKGRCIITLDSYYDKEVNEDFSIEYLNELDKCENIYKILNCNNVPRLYRRLYFLNYIISDLFPCEYDTKNKFCNIRYSTYEYSREIEFD